MKRRTVLSNFGRRLPSARAWLPRQPVVLHVRGSLEPWLAKEQILGIPSPPQLQGRFKLRPLAVNVQLPIMAGDRPEYFSACGRGCDYQEMRVQNIQPDGECFWGIPHFVGLYVQIIGDCLCNWLPLIFISYCFLLFTPSTLIFSLFCQVYCLSVILLPWKCSTIIRYIIVSNGVQVIVFWPIFLNLLRRINLCVSNNSLQPPSGLRRIKIFAQNDVISRLTCTDWTIIHSKN